MLALERADEDKAFQVGGDTNQGRQAITVDDRPGFPDRILRHLGMAGTLYRPNQVKT